MAKRGVKTFTSPVKRVLDVILDEPAPTPLLEDEARLYEALLDAFTPHYRAILDGEFSNRQWVDDVSAVLLETEREALTSIMREQVEKDAEHLTRWLPLDEWHAVMQEAVATMAEDLVADRVGQLAAFNAEYLARNVDPAQHAERLCGAERARTIAIDTLAGAYGAVLCLFCAMFNAIMKEAGL